MGMNCVGKSNTVRVKKIIIAFDSSDYQLTIGFGVEYISYLGWCAAQCETGAVNKPSGLQNQQLLVQEAAPE